MSEKAKTKALAHAKSAVENIEAGDFTASAQKLSQALDLVLECMEPNHTPQQQMPTVNKQLASDMQQNDDWPQTREDIY